MCSLCRKPLICNMIFFIVRQIWVFLACQRYIPAGSRCDSSMWLRFYQHLHGSCKYVELGCLKSFLTCVTCHISIVPGKQTSELARYFRPSMLVIIYNDHDSYLVGALWLMWSKSVWPSALLPFDEHCYVTMVYFNCMGFFCLTDQVSSVALL